jgi:peptidoglycan hydrolase-like protein with peptidoglycan-binding domain
MTEMKKVLLCMLLICMVASLGSLSAFADAPTEDNTIVNRASALATNYSLWGRNSDYSITYFTIPYGSVVGIGYTTQGYYVTAVQHSLSTIDWDNNDGSGGWSIACVPDGQFGSKTYSAVFTYQDLAASRRPADGIVGPKTWSGLAAHRLWT